jgi:hypothetical protein
MLKKRYLIKLTQAERDAAIGAIYTQLAAIKGLGHGLEMKDEVKALRSALKRLIRGF